MDIRRIDFSKRLVELLILAFVLSACKPGGSPTASQTSSLPAEATTSPSARPDETPTPASPTPTPAPLAAKVNSEGITLAEYQAEQGRYQAAVGRELTPEDEKLVLDDLINQMLMAQAATEQGFTLSEANLQARLDELAESLGGAQVLADWMNANGYSEEDFRLSLTRSIHAAWMRDKIAATVPETADQVHARQILTRTPEKAAEYLGQLKAGSDFAALAKQVDPLTGGELGWFPRGYLYEPQIEEAAFSLQPGQFSEVIQTRAGYHILQVIEREAEHTLDSQARLTLQTQALQNWLEERRSQSQIEIL
jgi:peptidyl-prolyl cis-trans isomerase C